MSVGEANALSDSDRALKGKCTEAQSMARCKMWLVRKPIFIGQWLSALPVRPYLHDHRANKDSYPQDSNNQCIILRLQLSFVTINVQLMFV